MSWQQQQNQRLPRILTDSEQPTNEATTTKAAAAASSSSSTMSSSSRQMGPPSQSLPSLNFRQLAPLRSPNLPSSMHSSSYFSQQRHRSTSESIANDALRTLRHGLPLLPKLPEPPSNIHLSSAKRGETLPPLSAFGSPSSLYGEQQSSGGSGRSNRVSSSSHYYHPYQQQQQQQHQPYYQSSPVVSSLYRSPSTMHTPASPGTGPITYSGLPSSRMPSSNTSQESRLYSPSSPSNAFDRSMDRSRESSSNMDRDDPNSPRKLAKSHVPSACLNCKRAHLACDVSRPCRRCINLGKTDTCIDVQHKKRGRPRLRDREAAAAAAAAAAATSGVTTTSIGLPDQRISSGMPGQRLRGSISSTSTTSTMRQSPRSEQAAFFSSELNTIPSPTRASNIPLMMQRRRSISSNASLWSQTTPSGGVSGSASGEFSNDTSSPTVSLILSTGMQCARCSVESHALLGYSPTDLVERSLFELVHPSETNRLEQLWLSLIEPVGVKSQVVPANAEQVMNTSPAVLMTPAPGTVYMQETMRLRQRSGIYDFYSIRLHLGGGFGADLYQSSTLDRAYIVASLLKLGNDTTHPDPSLLREARWYLGNDPRHFTTPQSNGTASSTRGTGNSSSSTAGTGYGVGSAAIDSESASSNNHQNTASNDFTGTASNRYDWQRLDRDSKPTPAPLSQDALPPPPPPYSKNAYHNQSATSNYDTESRQQQQDRSLHDSRKSDQHISTSKSSSTSILFSYSSGGERGSILC